MILSEALFLLEIGFLPVSVWDILDVLIVSYLLYQLYTLVRGSIAFNIFIGVITLYALYFIVGVLGMEMLRAILGQFVSVGVIIIIIIFQPEIRRFLVLLGNTTLRQRSAVIQRLLRISDGEKGAEMKSQGEQIELKKAILSMSNTMTGALIVVSKNAANEPIGTSGTPLNAEVTDELIRTIFDKSTPLHDGALLIQPGKIYKAGCILPVSERTDLPQSVGLRHRAAVGLSERSQAVAFIVSEETGFISVASSGKLLRRINEAKLEEEIRAAYS